MTDFFEDFCFHSFARRLRADCASPTAVGHAAIGRLESDNLKMLRAARAALEPELNQGIIGDVAELAWADVERVDDAPQ